jgi:predicted dehydrogenase
MEMSNKKRIGIIGTGNISHSHMAGYKNLDNVEVVAVCDINEERVKNYAKQYGVEHAFTDYNEILKLDLDGVSVTTWNKAHAGATITALKAGKHVLCEKPLAMTVDEALEMQKTAEETGKLLMVGFVMRFEKKAQLLLDLFQKGRFGQIYFTKVSYLRRVGNPCGWYGDKSLSGGGPLIDVGPHVVDIGHYLMGQPKPTAISGATFNYIGPRSNVKGVDRYIPQGKGNACDVEDMTVAMVRFSNGAIMEVETSYSQHIEKDRINIECYGTKGGFVYEPELKIYTEMDDYLIDIKPWYGWDSDEAEFNREIAHFVDCFDDPSKCISPGKDGVEIMRILRGIYESAEQGREIIL